jgi:CelD/BcsL family acetyltransferase involved in cellulose biosynthesis
LKINEINNNQFSELKSVWNHLLNKCKDSNPFLTWEYLFTYWKHFGSSRKLKILCVENENNDVIAIAPLRLSRYNLANLVTYNVLEPLGYRGADYTGFIIPEIQNECINLILKYLNGQKDWDFIYLLDVPETSITSHAFKKTGGNASKFEVIKGAVCPYIPLPASMDIFLSKLSPSFRKNLKKRLRKLEKDFQKVELKSYKDFSTVKEAMNIFFNLHQKRWTLKGMPGVFNLEKIRNFYIEVAKIFAEKEWLALYFLTVDDKPIAARYSFEYNSKMYFLLPGIDPDYSQYAPGHIMHLKVIEKCIEKGITECDFLKGGEPYKFEWTNSYRRNLGFRFVNKSKKESILYGFAIKTLRRARLDRVFGKFLRF